MNKIDEFNKAIEILKTECQSHEYCKECPFSDATKFISCNLYGEPYTWEQLKEQKNDCF